MRLKRVFDHSSGAPVLADVEVLRAGAKQKFPAQFVTQAALEGWLRLVPVPGGGSKFALTTTPPVSYRIVRGPGRYCCHCGVLLSDEEAARAHVATKHAGKPSPDAQNPSGYERINHFDCVKE